MPKSTEPSDNIDDLQADFTHIEFTRMDDAANAQRWYCLCWQPTIEGWAVVRMHGRIGSPKHTLSPLLFDSLDEAWPTIRATIRKRLRNGYSVQREKPTLPRPGVSIRFEPSSLTKEEIAAYKQLALVSAGDGQDAQAVDNGAHNETPLPLFTHHADCPSGPVRLHAAGQAEGG